MKTASARSSAHDVRTFVARMGALALAQDFVEAFGRANRVADDDVLRLQLVVEELFTNTVRHGYRRECDQPIEIALEVDHDRITLRYRDAAQPHDPLATLDESREALQAPLTDRPVGGLGVPLVAGLVDEVDYTLEKGRNCVRVTLHLAKASR